MFFANYRFYHDLCTLYFSNNNRVANKNLFLIKKNFLSVLFYSFYLNKFFKKNYLYFTSSNLNVFNYKYLSFFLNFVNKSWLVLFNDFLVLKKFFQLPERTLDLKPLFLQKFEFKFKDEEIIRRRKNKIFRKYLRAGKIMWRLKRKFKFFFLKKKVNNNVFFKKNLSLYFFYLYENYRKVKFFKKIIDKNIFMLNIFDINFKFFIENDDYVHNYFLNTLKVKYFVLIDISEETGEEEENDFFEILQPLSANIIFKKVYKNFFIHKNLKNFFVYKNFFIKVYDFYKLDYSFINKNIIKPNYHNINWFISDNNSSDFFEYNDYDILSNYIFSYRLKKKKKTHKPKNKFFRNLNINNTIKSQFDVLIKLLLVNSLNFDFSLIFKKRYNINYSNSFLFLFFHKLYIFKKFNNFTYNSLTAYEYNSITPIHFLEKPLKRLIINKFRKNFTPSYFKYLYYYASSVLESFLKKRVYLKINSKTRIPKREFHNLVFIFQKHRNFQTKVGRGFFFFEMLEIIWLSFYNKDLNYLIDWFIKTMNRIPFKQHKKLLSVFKFIITKYFSVFSNTGDVRGFFFDIRGKVGVSGNAKKRHFSFYNGMYSKTTKNSRFDYQHDIIRTSTGALGVTMILYY